MISYTRQYNIKTALNPRNARRAIDVFYHKVQSCILLISSVSTISFFHSIEQKDWIGWATFNGNCMALAKQTQSRFIVNRLSSRIIVLSCLSFVVCRSQDLYKQQIDSHLQLTTNINYWLLFMIGYCHSTLRFYKHTFYIQIDTHNMVHKIHFAKVHYLDVGRLYETYFM